MQIFRSWIFNIKNDRKLFQYLANKLYKFFNVIERNDLVQLPHDKKIYRVLDVYDTGAFDYLCDDDPSPIRQKWNGRATLFSKFFKGVDHYRSEKHDNGWRFLGGVFYNFKTKEILPCK